MTTPAVTVVVPTVLRPSLARAVRSVRGQDYAGRLELVVVVDRDRAECSVEELSLLAGVDVTVFTGGGRLAGAARNLGAARATSPLLAFLDDDDAWLPGKLTAQVPLLLQQESEGQVVVGSRLVQRHSVTGRTSGPVPRDLLAEEQRVEDYLFRGRRPGVARPTLQTSTLLMRTTTARSVQWRPGLRRHQDWDWLLSAQQDHGVRLVHHPDVTVVYDMGSVGSISSGAAWSESLAWARSWRHRWSRRTYADFVCAQPLRYAIQARSLPGVAACLRAGLANGCLPGPGPAVFAAAAVLPRTTIERLLTSSGAGSSSTEGTDMSTTILVSHLTPTFGLEKSVLRLAEDLGPDVTVVCIGDPRAPGLLPDVQVTSLGSRLTGWSRLASIVRLRRWSAQQSGTVVAAGVWAVLPLLASRRALPFRIVAWEHTLTEERTGTSRRLALLRRAAAVLYRRADLVVCVSDDLRRQVDGWLRGVPSTTIPNHLPARPHVVPAPRAGDLSGAHAVRLLSVGSLTSVKNYPLLLRALSLLPEHYVLDVLGDGNMDAALRALAGDLGVTERVTFRGYVADPVPYYAGCDVVVQPSLSETFGFVMFEAASNDKPLVAVDFPHARDLVPDLIVGRLGAPTPEGLAAAVLATVTELPPRDAFVDAQRRRDARFSAEAVLAAWVEAVAPAAADPTDASSGAPAAVAR